MVEGGRWNVTIGTLGQAGVPHLYIATWLTQVPRAWNVAPRISCSCNLSLPDIYVGVSCKRWVLSPSFLSSSNVTAFQCSDTSLRLHLSVPSAV